MLVLGGKRGLVLGVPAPLQIEGGIDAKAIWRNHVRPWLQVVICSALFLASLFQSIAFINKFNQGPISTTIRLEELTKAETPWFTFCPSPGINFLELDALSKSENSSFRMLSKSPARANWFKGFAPDMLSAIQPGENRSFLKEMETFMDQVAWPVWKQLTFVKVDKASGTRYDVDSLDRYDGGFSLDKPMIYNSSMGSWESFLMPYILKMPMFHVCSTFKPSFSLNAEDITSLQFGFVNAISKNYNLSDVNVLNQLGTNPEHQKRSAHVPHLYMYVTEPGVMPSFYQSINPGEARYRTVRLGEKVQLQLMNVEKYEFFSTNDDPCQHQEVDMDGDELQGSITQCLTNCVESLVLATRDKCRLPGYRSTLGKEKPSFHPPRVCNSSSDFAALSQMSNTLNSLTAKSSYSLCQKLCHRPCSKIRYDWIDMPPPTVNLSPAISCAEMDLYNESLPAHMICDRFSSVEIIPKQELVKVIKEELAYDTSQLISDLGGTWGLLLGVSFMTLLACVEQGIMACMPSTPK